jgi:transmembrane sensor
MDIYNSVDSLLLNESFLRYWSDPQSEDAKMWEQKMNNGLVSRELVNEAKSVLDLLRPSLSHHEIEAEISKLKLLIAEREASPYLALASDANDGDEDERLVLTGNQRRVKQRWVYGAAAAVVLVASTALVLRKGNEIEKPVITSVSSGFGEQKKFILPDGSTVSLNSNSTVYFDTDYNKNERRVMLKGEAFFEVAKNKEKPFSVSTGEFTTTALGTSFLVKADSAGKYAVQLLEGKVQVQARAKRALLDAGEEVTWQHSEKEFSKQKFIADDLQNWVEGRLEFRMMPASEVFDMLERWYGVDISDQRKERKNTMITGSYHNASLMDVLQVICFTLNCETRIQNNQVVVQ